MATKKIYLAFDEDILDDYYRDDDDLDCLFWAEGSRKEAEKHASEYKDRGINKKIVELDLFSAGSIEIKYVERDPDPEENPLATRFGGSDKEWNKYLKLRKGDKVRFKKSAFEYKGHENDIYTMTSDGVFSMGGSLCGMFDNLSGAYCMSVFDVVEE